MEAATIAQAFVNNLIQYRKKEISMTTKQGESILKKVVGSNIVKTIGATGAIAGTLMALDKAVGKAADISFSAGLKRKIQYAKSKYPELARVGDETLARWAKAIYTVAPKVAGNEELLADALYHIKQYGGKFDLATVKMFSSITKDVGNKKSDIPAVFGTAASIRR